MRNGSAFISTIVYTNRKLAKLSKSLRHSLRVEIDGESSISYKRDYEILNQVLFNNESEEFLQDLNNKTPEEYLQFIDEIIKTNIEKEQVIKISKSDAQVRSKSLKYLKDNIQDTKFHKLLEKFAESPNEENNNNLIIYFDTLETKKVVRKNLDKYMNVIEKVGKAKNRSEAKESNKERVEFVEMVVKIPHDNNIIDISSEDMLLYNQDFFKRNFPDYDIVVGVSHNDELHQSKKPDNIEKWEKEHNKKYEVGESGFHSHLFANTKNKITGEFDYYPQQHLLVAKYLKSKGISEEDIKKDIGYINEEGKRVQTRKQMSNQGKNLQDLIYEDINKNLFNGKNYNAVVGYNNLSITQKQEMEKEKTLSINSRKFSGIELEKKILKEDREELEQQKENIVEDIKTEHSEKLSEIKQFKEVKEELSNEVIELESQVDYLSKEQTREVELKGKNDLKVEELEEMTLKIIQKKEEESKVDTSIQKLKEDREKVSKKGLESRITTIASKIVNNTDNYNYKFVDKDKMKSQMIKEVRKLLKVDMYDNDIQIISKRIQTKSDNKVLEMKTKMGDLQKKYNTLDTEHTTLKDNVKSIVAEQVEKVEDTYQSTISTLENNHKNSITSLESKHKEKVEDLQTEHNQETYKLNNIIDNKDITISTLQKDKSKLQIQVKKLQDKYQSFKSKIKSMFVKSSDLNNGLKNTVDKLQNTTNEFREKVSDLEYDIKLINKHDNSLIDTLNKEEDKRIEEYFKNHETMELPTEGKEPSLIIKPLDTKSVEMNFNKDKEEDNNQSHSSGHRQ